MVFKSVRILQLSELGCEHWVQVFALTLQNGGNG
jgi:hypothetical protein